MSGSLMCVETAGQQVTLQQIDAAWRNRQARSQSVDVTWDVETVTVENEAELQGGAFGPTKQQVQDLAHIKREVRHKYKQRLIVAGERIRYEDNQLVYYVPMRSYVESSSISVFDGLRGKNLKTMNVPNVFEHQGVIGPASERGQDIRQESHLRPLMLHFLPLMSLPKFTSEYVVTPDVGSIEGVDCVILRRIARARVESLWLDPQQCLVLRESVEENAIISRQMDVAYTDDPAWGPLPKSWTFAFYDQAGNLRHSITGDVENISINEPLSEGAFDVVFPVDTLVTDATRLDANGEYTQYVVRPNNRERLVLPEEKLRVKSARDLIETKTGRAGYPVSNPRPSAWISVGLLSLALVALITFRFFYYRRAAT